MIVHLWRILLLNNEEPPANLVPHPLSSSAFQSPRMNRVPRPKVLHTDFESANLNNDQAKQTIGDLSCE